MPQLFQGFSQKLPIRSLKSGRKNIIALFAQDLQTALRASRVRTIPTFRRQGNGARKFFEENFRPVRISKLGEHDGSLDRLLRADRRRAAHQAGRIYLSALSARRRNSVARKAIACAACATASAASRGLFRPRRDRGRRAHRAAAGNLLAEGSDRGPFSSMFKAPRAFSSRTASWCGSTTTPITAILTFPSARC